MKRRRNRMFSGFCIFPGYRWCGPGCSGPGAPINAVDAACKAHDDADSRHGSNCEADRQFQLRLKQLMNPYTKEGRHATLMYNYMNIQSIFKCGFH
ncbi:phospholipase [Bacillus sp. DJP31]|uniref:phospholipase n=1 Tax=Bacillus sp. DJP31 TaxID=3409789 RepID=UPI003BB5F3B5